MEVALHWCCLQFLTVFLSHAPCACVHAAHWHALGSHSPYTGLGSENFSCFFPHVRERTGHMMSYACMCLLLPCPHHHARAPLRYPQHGSVGATILVRGQVRLLADGPNVSMRLTLHCCLLDAALVPQGASMARRWRLGSGGLGCDRPRGLAASSAGGREAL